MIILSDFLTRLSGGCPIDVMVKFRGSGNQWELRFNPPVASSLLFKSGRRMELSIDNWVLRSRILRLLPFQVTKPGKCHLIIEVDLE